MKEKKERNVKERKYTTEGKRNGNNLIDFNIQLQT